MLLSQFSTVVELSLLLAPIILLLLLSAPFLRKRYTAGLRCFLWMALAIRLLLPIANPGERPIMLRLMPSELQSTATAEVIPPAFIPREGIAPQDVTITNSDTASSPKAYLSSTDKLQWIGVMWMIGAGAFLLYHLMMYALACQQLKRWSCPVWDKQIINTFESLKQTYKLTKTIQLYQSNKTSSPLLFGFLQPKIVLPALRQSDEQLRAVLSHELVHYKRRDLWFKLLLLLAQACHWFNPLVWWMVHIANLDIELACDSAVLSNADSNVRKSYGLAVLDSMVNTKPFSAPLTTYFGVGKKQVTQRFENIVSGNGGKKKGKILLGGICTIALSCGILIGCSAQPQMVPADPSFQEVEQTETITPVLDTENQKAMEPDPLIELTDGQLQQKEILRDLDAIYNNIQWDESPYKGGEMVWPAPEVYAIQYPYGYRFDGSDFHTGMDITGDEVYGKSIMAANDGTVRLVNKEYTPGLGYGIYLIVDHGGNISTLYAHCSEVYVQEGDAVKKGQTIAAIGSTGWSVGPHLHFEVRVDGKHVDPLPYVSDSPQSVGFVWPTDGGNIAGEVNSYPGHTGVDIPQPEGTLVYASAAGTVTEAKETLTGYGKYILIDHDNGYQTLYAHNSSLSVKVGDQVSQGQTIAAVGRSGRATDYMLHFEVRYNGNIMNPGNYIVNP